MSKEPNAKKENKGKGFLARFLEKVDTKMQEKVKAKQGCCSSEKSQDNSCCS